MAMYGTCDFCDQYAELMPIECECECGCWGNICESCDLEHHCCDEDDDDKEGGEIA